MLALSSRRAIEGKIGVGGCWNVWLFNNQTLPLWLWPHLGQSHKGGGQNRKKKWREFLTWEADEGHVIALTTGGQKGDLLLCPPLHHHGGQHLLVVRHEHLLVDGRLGTHGAVRAGKLTKPRRGPLAAEGERRSRGSAKQEQIPRFLHKREKESKQESGIFHHSTAWGGRFFYYSSGVFFLSVWQRFFCNSGEVKRKKKCGRFIQIAVIEAPPVPCVKRNKLFQNSTLPPWWFPNFRTTWRTSAAASWGYFLGRVAIEW